MYIYVNLEKKCSLPEVQHKHADLIHLTFNELQKACGRQKHWFEKKECKGI